MGKVPVSALAIHVLGPGNVLRSGVPVALPRSRKVRALLAFLALEPSAASRMVPLDLSDCSVDALEVERAMKVGLGQASAEQVGAPSKLFGGDLFGGFAARR